MRLSTAAVFILLMLQQGYSQQKPVQVKPLSSVDTSYRLLWYKGKKIRPNVLLTPKYDTVSYTPAKGLVKVSSKAGLGRRYDKMMLDVGRTQQRMNETMQALIKSAPKHLVPYYASPLKAAYERVQDDLTTALANRIELPELANGFGSAAQSELPVEKTVTSQVSASYKAAPAPSGKAKEIENFYRNLKVSDIKDLAAMKEVLTYYENHKNDVITYVPTPPRNEYTYCNECDTSSETRFKREFEVYWEEFIGKDQYMMQQVLGMMREAEIMFTEELKDEVYRLLNPVSDWLYDRTDRKGRLLVEKFMDDPSRVRTVTMIGLSIERQHQLLGIGKQDGFYLDAFLRGQQALSKMIKKAIEEYDYSIALNLSLILSVERQFQLLGTASMQAMHVSDMLNFNQFKMHMDVSAKINLKGGYQLAHLRGDNWFAAVPDKNCSLQWILLGPDKDKVKTKLLAAELKGGAIEIPYVGTKDWEATKPLMRIDFCGKGKDTIEAFNFHGEQSKELWVYPPPVGVTVAANMHTVLVGCFIDLQRAYEKAAYFKNPANIEKMKQQMMQQHQEFLKNGGADMARNAANMNAQDVQKMMQMAKAMDAGKQVVQSVHLPAIASYLVLPQVANRQRIILKERLNGKEIFPQNPATEYAWFNITLEQDPGSPYKLIDVLIPK